MKKTKKKLSKKKKTTYFALVVFILVSAYQFYKRYSLRNDFDIIQASDTIKYNAVFRYINDGDTAVFIVDGEEVTCRFLAIDCPEIDEEGYNEANSFTNTYLRNAKKIVLELDPHSDKYDKFDRLLAWIWVDNELLQAKLIESGNAQIRYLYDDYLYTDVLYRIYDKVQKDR